MTAREKASQEGGFFAVTVEDMAARRELRAAEQRRLIIENPDCAVVCLSMNIAGPVKRTAAIELAFFNAGRELANALAAAGFIIPRLVLTLEKTGPEAMLAVALAGRDAAEIKKITVAVEEKDAACRLLDIDVIGRSGEKLSRGKPRKCLLCGENAAICARSRAHSVAELQNRTAELLFVPIAELAAEAAHDALVREVELTPKPGLVDRSNSGANSDMDIDTFRRSADALRPYFEKMALAVIKNGRDRGCALAFSGEEFSPELLAELRLIGLDAERAMLAATNGVNTHRGAIYTLGLLVCSLAGALAAGRGLSPSELTKGAASLASALGDGAQADSNGAIVRKRYGVGGAVEQAALGFPLVLTALEARAEYAEKLKSAGIGVDPFVVGLLAVMAELDDNNALRRGGAEGAAFVKKRAAELMLISKNAPFTELLDALLGFDAELTEKNISCGGAADLIAAAMLLDAARDARRGEELLRSLERETSLG